MGGWGFYCNFFSWKYKIVKINNMRICEKDRLVMFVKFKLCNDKVGLV